MRTRGSGVLLHISSLPSGFGMGDMGPEAFRFADCLAGCGQNYWQILPLNPTDLIYDSSPYHSISAFAFNPLLISPELLARDKLLTESELAGASMKSSSQVDFPKVVESKTGLLRLAAERFEASLPDPEYERFVRGHAWWLNDYTLYLALRDEFTGKDWADWPEEFRDRNPETMKDASSRLAGRIEREKILQYLFIRQWTGLKSYCNGLGLNIIGDLPIYVDFESADLWTGPEMFKLDERKRPYVVAGVPPDYFSATGQLWGNPIYDWDRMRSDRFRWWADRIRHNLRLFDYVRIDHFRGLVAAWEIPAGEKDAVNGRWVENPVIEFLNRMLRSSAGLPIIAEDLGHITPDVREVMSMFELPGMKVLMFAFGDDMGSNPYIPHNVVPNSLYYTGTHDNNTVRGWFENEIDDIQRDRVREYLGRDVSGEELPWEMIRLVMMSRSNTSIIPLQDILCLGQQARMNRPSVAEGNWGWRLVPGQLEPAHCERLHAMTRIYGRA